MINSKRELIDYALRSLGEPTIKVNVTDEQISDRLDDALNKFRNFHYSGTQRIFAVHQVTAQDVQNMYIPIPDNVVGIVRVLPYVEGSGTGTTAGDSGLFSVQYQIRLGDLWNITSGNVAYYESVMQNMRMIDQVFNGTPTMRWTQVVDKLYLDAIWGGVVKEGMYICFECYVTSDPEEYRKIYDQIWIKEYFTALIKKQWASNIKKFSGILMLGGVTINGQDLYQEALMEIKDLEAELRDVYEEPPIFMVG